jgi:hypothetical protein
MGLHELMYDEEERKKESARESRKRKEPKGNEKNKEPAATQARTGSSCNRQAGRLPCEARSVNRLKNLELNAQRVTITPFARFLVEHRNVPDQLIYLPPSFDVFSTTSRQQRLVSNTSHQHLINDMPPQASSVFCSLCRVASDHLTDTEFGR